MKRVAISTKNSVANPKTSSSKRAFTLIELLVVIAIVSLMIGRRMPAVQAACNNEFEAHRRRERGDDREALRDALRTAVGDSVINSRPFFC